jgi:hypothetical protein
MGVQGGVVRTAENDKFAISVGKQETALRFLIMTRCHKKGCKNQIFSDNIAAADIEKAVEDARCPECDPHSQWLLVRNWKAMIASETRK